MQDYSFANGRFITVKSFAAGLFWTFRLCLQWHVPPGGLHLAVSRMASGFSVVFSAVCLVQQAMKSVLRAFSFFLDPNAISCRNSIFLYFSDFESVNWFWLGKPFYARGWGHTCFSVAEAQHESTYLVAVCEVSQSDAECTQHKGKSGNSCLQFETLLPALGLCWLILCLAMSFCLLRKIQWNYMVNQMQCHLKHWKI